MSWRHDSCASTPGRSLALSAFGDSQESLPAALVPLRHPPALGVLAGGGKLILGARQLLAQLRELK